LNNQLNHLHLNQYFRDSREKVLFLRIPLVKMSSSDEGVRRPSSSEDGGEEEPYPELTPEQRKVARFFSVDPEVMEHFREWVLSKVAQRSAFVQGLTARALGLSHPTQTLPTILDEFREFSLDFGLSKGLMFKGVPVDHQRVAALLRRSNEELSALKVDPQMHEFLKYCETVARVHGN
jgi:hypothetical protein